MQLSAQPPLENKSQQVLTYLALGDSYTIGEAVPLRESFPYQVVQKLRQKGVLITAPEIVATTGWTTDELAAGIQSHHFLPGYDWVTLLIGVNNQYRGRTLENYRQEFSALLQQAIHYSGKKKNKVLCISIPDYGATPFAKDRNREKIGSELDAYNKAAEAICAENAITFINITEGSRAALNDPSLVASDGLHPSGKEYYKWAEKIAQYIIKNQKSLQP